MEKMVQAELPDKCLKRIQLPALQGELPVTFYVCKMGPLLQHVVDCCPNFAEQLIALIDKNPCRQHQLISYHDACTAGNVLQHGSGKKCSLFYVAIRELQCLDDEKVWHPLALIQHRACSQVRGGFSAVWKAVVTSLVEDLDEAGLALEFPSAHPGRADQHRILFLRQRLWLGDLDAIKLSLDARGSASIRPCIRCKNVLKKDSELTSIDDYFVEISCSDVSRFDPQSNAEIFTLIDELLAKKPVTSKTEMKNQEKLSGFNCNPDGAMACPLVRENSPPDCWMFDVMHLYYSNGVASLEVCLLLDLMKEEGFTLEMLQDLFGGTAWQRSHQSATISTTSARRHLVDPALFGGEFYKGSAKELFVLLPLLGFYLNESPMKNLPKLVLPVISFNVLLEIRLLLSDIKHGVSLDSNRLTELQQKHQAAFIAAYGGSHIRPKHHVRMHLQEQFEKTGLLIDTLPMEKKHKAWFYFISIVKFVVLRWASCPDLSL